MSDSECSCKIHSHGPYEGPTPPYEVEAASYRTPNPNCPVHGTTPGPSVPPEIERLRSALKFYAEGGTDYGHIATKALKAKGVIEDG